MGQTKIFYDLVTYCSNAYQYCHLSWLQKSCHVCKSGRMYGWYCGAVVGTVTSQPEGVRVRFQRRPFCFRVCTFSLCLRGFHDPKTCALVGASVSVGPAVKWRLVWGCTPHFALR